MAGSETAIVQKSPCNESVLLRSLRRFRDKYIGYTRRPLQESTTPESTPHGSLGSLPVDLQFIIMTLLSPPDLCHLGATSTFWQVMVRDPLLWRYFLLRDMPHWPSIDHVTMPRLKDLTVSLFDREEETDEMQLEPQQDLMAEYLRGSPACRQRLQPPQQLYRVVTSLMSYVRSAEPRYAMFGPGMEQLDVSIVTKLMHSPDLLPVVETTQRQINGIGSGISYMYKNQHKFNILTLYSTNRAERERARVEHQSVPSKLFILEGTDQSGRPIYTPTPQVQEVCNMVNGYIYVANAEQTGEGELERAQIQAVLGHSREWSDRPLLVLSCVSREDPDLSTVRTRTSCVDMAQRLGLPLLPNPWMVQDTVAESLSGVVEGLSWLLHHSGVRV